MLNGLLIIKTRREYKMKRILVYIVILVIGFAALLCIASCKENEPEQTAAVNTPVPISETYIPSKDTAAPTDSATEAPTEIPTPETTAESTHDPDERPEPVTVEWLAAELMRRYYTGIYLTFELENYSDIMDRNEETNLFYYDNQLEIDSRKSSDWNVLEISRGEAGIVKTISESETEIIVDIWIKTYVIDDNPISGDSVGSDCRITVDKQRMMIVAYDRPNMCEGYYRNDLKPLALRYRNQGLSWQDADKKAYDELHARLVSEG